MIQTTELFQIEPVDWNIFANQILEIERNSFPPSLRDSRRALQSLIQSRTSVALGLRAKISGVLAGYIAGNLLEAFTDIPGIIADPHFGYQDTMYIESLAVSSEWRHRGCGTALTRSFLKRAVEMNFQRTTAHIASESAAKIMLPFRVLGSIDNWYKTGRTFQYIEFLSEE